ncbi:MAG: SoxR reducing system RseC family protein [Candidatus Marinimicrobia bacterium]|nr:SoxR reducing system RseC family protein [Candidatus Neomarinimicrobiota bacterium]
MSTSGLVIDKKDGKMSIRIEQDQTACEACAARVFCSKSSCEDANMILADRPDIHIGDHVQIEESKNILIKTSLVAYGIPLLFFVTGALLGQFLPETRIPSELLQFACGCIGLLIGGFLGRWIALRISKRIENYIGIKVNK